MSWNTNWCLLSFQTKKSPNWKGWETKSTVIPTATHQPVPQPLPAAQPLHQPLSQRSTLAVTRQNCADLSQNTALANTVKNASLPMDKLSWDQLLDIPNTRQICAKHTIPLDFVLMDHGVISFTIWMKSPMVSRWLLYTIIRDFNILGLLHLIQTMCTNPRSNKQRLFIRSSRFI